ncbi:hypothetical protein J132_07797 [Termitomyces sp. J132]|nr:hypothetical protein J132_07797 [Termitomyces sp. J132]
MDSSAAEAWKTLTENYGIFSEIAAMNAEKQLQATEFSDRMDFPKHVEDLREKWKSATKRGAKIYENTFRTILMTSLPESWNAVVAGMYTMTTTKDVVVALMVHWDRLISQKQKAGILATALQTQTNPLKPKLVCINPNCRQSGHIIKNCYWKGGGKEGQFPPNFRNRGKTSKTLSTETPTQTTTPTANVATSLTPQVPEQPHVTYALSTMVPERHELVKWTGAHIPKNTNIPTYVDSGATDHFFVNRSEFLDYEELKSPIQRACSTKRGIVQGDRMWNSQEDMSHGSRNIRADLQKCITCTRSVLKPDLYKSL